LQLPSKLSEHPTTTQYTLTTTQNTVATT